MIRIINYSFYSLPPIVKIGAPGTVINAKSNYLYMALVFTLLLRAEILRLKAHLKVTTHQKT